MFRLLTILFFFGCLAIKAQHKIPAELDSAEKSKSVIPIEKSSKQQSPKPQLLNGCFVLYNKSRKKTKGGIFKDNRLIDGKNYIYDEEGNLKTIQLY